MSARYPLVRNSNAFATRFGVLTSPSRFGSSPSSTSSFLISSCILALYISVAAQSPDDLYANRADLASARKAAEAWSAELARQPQSSDAAWKLARADYWLGGHTPENEQRTIFERGIEAARKAVAIEANRPEGHFWLAANMGALAESFGLRQGIKYRK